LKEETSPQDAQGKKLTEEDKIHKIIWDSILGMQSDVDSLNKAIDFNEENPRKLAILINARARIQQQILYCIVLLRNPKLKLSIDSGRNLDFARMIKKALDEENPLVRKMVEEANPSLKELDSKGE
jgi:hypothetical protein